MNRTDPRSEPVPGPVRLPLRKRELIAWVISVLVLCSAAAFYWFRYYPLDRAYGTLLSTLNARGSELEDIRTGLSRLQREHLTLEADRATLEGRLQRAVAQRNAALNEMNRTKAELSSRLSAEIATGDIVLEQKGDELVVDLADKILFAQGEAEVSEQGRQVLDRVATTLKKVKSHVFEVGGHTDSSPIVSSKVREAYATNWELSTARATNVVRFLESHGIPGRSLVAAGFSQYRPVASNSSRYGRQRNRRIEIVLARSSR
jgi:chemotaxis protein MotB